MVQDEDIYTFFEPELPPEASDAEKRAARKHVYWRSSSGQASPESAPLNVMNLAKENYFSCAVGRTRTRARYLLSSSDDVVALLKEMATPSEDSNSSAWALDALWKRLFWYLSFWRGPVPSSLIHSWKHRPLEVWFSTWNHMYRKSMFLPSEIVCQISCSGLLSLSLVSSKLELSSRFSQRLHLIRIRKLKWLLHFYFIFFGRKMTLLLKTRF